MQSVRGMSTPCHFEGSPTQTSCRWACQIHFAGDQLLATLSLHLAHGSALQGPLDQRLLSSDLSPDLFIKLVLFLSPFSLFLLWHPPSPHVSLAFTHPAPFFYHRCPHLCFSPTSAPWGGQPLEHPSSAEDASDAPSLPPSYKGNQSSFFSFHILPRCVFQPSHTTPHCPTSAAPPSPCTGHVHVQRHRCIFSLPKALIWQDTGGTPARLQACRDIPGSRRCTSGMGRAGSAAEEKAALVHRCLVISAVCRRAHTAPRGRTPYFTPAALRKL